jgi:hypothetical protein
MLIVQMRRIPPLHFPDDSNKGTAIPSTPVVDMFGRLFGTILATLLGTDLREVSVAQNQLSEIISQIHTNFDGLKSKSQRSVSSGNELIPSTSEKDKDVNELRQELQELKNQLSRFPKSMNDRIDVGQFPRLKSLLENQSKSEFHLIPFRSAPIADGLISFLGRISQGNPHDKGVICATGTVYNDDARNRARNATDIQTDSYFISQNAENQILCYDFKNMRVAVTHYFLRSHGNQVNDNHLRSWVIEVSEDGSNWTEIDRRVDDNHLNGPNQSFGFEVGSVVETRYVRIRNLGPCWNGERYLYVRAFELFGGLRYL